MSSEIEKHVEAGDVDRPLSKIEQELPAKLQRLEDHGRAFLVTAIDVGFDLIAAREQVPFGQWGDWIAEHFEHGDRTAQRWMRAARKSDTLSELPLTLGELLTPVPKQLPPAAATTKLPRVWYMAAHLVHLWHKSVAMNATMAPEEIPPEYLASEGLDEMLKMRDAFAALEALLQEVGVLK